MRAWAEGLRLRATRSNLLGHDDDHGQVFSVGGVGEGTLAVCSRWGESRSRGSWMVPWSGIFGIIVDRSPDHN